jgi:hypothetical protein
MSNLSKNCMLFGGNGNKWPVLDNLYSFFSGNDIINFVSVGETDNMLFDIMLSELCGFNIKLFMIPKNEQEQHIFKHVQHILTNNLNREKALQYLKDENASEIFTEEQTRVVFNTYLNGKHLHEVEWKNTFMETYNNFQECKMCESINILKIDVDFENERKILFDIFDRGYRPGIIFVQFTNSPDEHVPTQLIAGHMHNVGYTLHAVHENKYMYVFNDNCIYDCTSYTAIHNEETSENPLVDAFTKPYNQLYEQMNEQIQNMAVQLQTLKNTCHNAGGSLQNANNVLSADVLEICKNAVETCKNAVNAICNANKC